MARCDSPGLHIFLSSQPMAETVSYLRLAAGSGITLAEQVRPASRLAIPIQTLPPSFARLSPILIEVDGGLTRLAMGAWAYRCGRLWRWRDACSKVRSDEVQDGPSWRSQAAIGPCGFTHRRSRADHPPSISLSAVRCVVSIA